MRLVVIETENKSEVRLLRALIKGSSKEKTLVLPLSKHELIKKLHAQEVPVYATTQTVVKILNRWKVPSTYIVQLSSASIMH